MMYRLIFLNSESKGQRVTVDMAPMTLGRDPDCRIVIKDDEVSRKHAVLEHTQEGLFIRDLGSMNRVLVNSREVREKRLKHGDVIELGRTQLLVQAIVQAEVEPAEGEEESSPRKEFALTTALFVLLLVAVVAGGVVYWRLMAAGKARRAAAAAATQSVAAEAPVKKTSEAPAAVVTNPAGDVKEMSEELKFMRKALSDIRESVDQLAQERATSPAPVAVASTQPSEKELTEQALKTKAEGMMEEARRKAKAGQLDEVDQILASIQLMLPDYLPAYEARARLFEHRGLLEKAIGQWVHIIQYGTDEQLAKKAMAERTRLAEAEKTAVPPEARAIRIMSVEQHKFLESKDFDEMRILDIALSPVHELSVSNASDVRVEVVFFDEDRKSGLVAPTAAVAPKESLRVEGPWAAQDQKVVTATYVVPHVDPVAGQPRERAVRFHGYVVKVYYKNRLEDQEARPRSLLNYSETRAAAPAP